jgi:potassium channel subfamily K
LTPKTHLGRGLLFPFAIGGIVILGLVVGSIRTLVLERGKKKMGARMLEKHRKKALKKMNKHDMQKLIPMTKEDEMNGNRKNAGTELERRRAEFELMRDIQSSAARNRKWISLIFSVSVWLTLWFVGAAVFQQAESNQGWSYFQSMYFAYTSLLTIGYGDFLLMSNSGKPFFVFWSLCAIPSLTILISNMGDTVIKMIHDVTIWIGNVSVLPGESKVMDTLKAGAAKVVQRKPHPPTADAKVVDGQRVQPHDAHHLKAGSLSDEDAEKDHHTLLHENTEYAHYMIAREICTVLEHLTASPAREYTFDEWTWYLELIGEDEASAATHRVPTDQTRQNQKKKQARENGRGGAQEADAAAGSDKSGGDGLQAAATPKESTGKKQWSWLEHRSPLMGDQGEAEWVLNRLTLKLEKELRALYRNRDKA